MDHFDRARGLAEALRDEAPSFVAAALDAFVTGWWSRTERRDRLIDVAYVLTRYLVAVAACALDLKGPDLTHQRPWFHAGEDPRLILGKHWPSTAPEPLSLLARRELLECLERLEKPRNAGAHRYACADEADLATLLDLLAPLLRLPILTVEETDSQEHDPKEGWKLWRVRRHAGLGRPRPTVEEVPESSARPRGPLLCVTDDPWLDLRPWVVQLNPLLHRDRDAPVSASVATLCEIGLVAAADDSRHYYMGALTPGPLPVAPKDADHFPERRRPPRPERCGLPAGRRAEDARSQALREAGWTIEEDLGSGAFGTVYRARREGGDRAYAVKVFHAAARPVERDRSERVLERLGGDASVEGVVRYHRELCRTQGHPSWVVMDFVPGVVLDEGWRRLDTDRRRELAFAIVEAAARLHRIGVVHRDLRPANILVDRESRPVIVDLGLARLDRSDSTRATATVGGLGFGVAPYAAPEQLRPHGDRVRDPRVDVHALAHLFASTLEGRPIDTLGDLPPDPLRDVLLGAGSSDPSERPRDAIELLRLLRAVAPSAPGPRAATLGRAFWKHRDDLRTARSLPPYGDERTWVWRLPDGPDLESLRDLGRAWAGCCAELPRGFRPLRAFDAHRRVAVVAAPPKHAFPLDDIERVAALALPSRVTLALDLVELLERVADASEAVSAPIGVWPSDVAVAPSGSAQLVSLRPSSSEELGNAVGRLLECLRGTLEHRELVRAPLGRTLEDLWDVDRDITPYVSALVADLRVLAGNGRLESRALAPEDRAELRALLGRATAIDSRATRRSFAELEAQAKRAHEAIEDEQRRLHEVLERERREAFELDELARRAKHRLDEAARRDRHERDGTNETFEPETFEPKPFEAEEFVPRDFDPEPFRRRDADAKIELCWRLELDDVLPMALAAPTERAVRHEAFHDRLRRVWEASAGAAGDGFDRAERLRFLHSAVWFLIGVEIDANHDVARLQARIDVQYDRSCPWRPIGSFETSWLRDDGQGRGLPWHAARAELAARLESLLDVLNEDGECDVAREDEVAQHEAALAALLRELLGETALHITERSAPTLLWNDGQKLLHPALFPVKQLDAASRARPGTRRIVTDALVGWPHRLRHDEIRWTLTVGAPPALPLLPLGAPRR